MNKSQIIALLDNIADDDVVDVRVHGIDGVVEASIYGFACQTRPYITDCFLLAITPELAERWEQEEEEGWKNTAYANLL